MRSEAGSSLPAAKSCVAGIELELASAADVSAELTVEIAEMGWSLPVTGVFGGGTGASSESARAREVVLGGILASSECFLPWLENGLRPTTSFLASLEMDERLELSA